MSADQIRFVPVDQGVYRIEGGEEPDPKIVDAILEENVDPDILELIHISERLERGEISRDQARLEASKVHK